MAMPIPADLPQMTSPAGFATGGNGVRRHLARQQVSTTDFRFGSKADIAALPINVRFTTKSGHWNSLAKCPLYATPDFCGAAKSIAIPITSSAHTSSDGTSRPIALVALS
jgi:hypothetical protein